MSEVTRIIAAVVDTRQLTLYHPDGSSLVIVQGDPRIRNLVDKVVPDLEAQGFCDLTAEDLALTTCYTEAEEAMNGFVRFFRMARTALDEILNKYDPDKVVAPLSVGSIPQTGNQEKPEKIAPATLTKSQAAVEEIMQHAAPAGSSRFEEQAGQKDHTTVAVLDDGTVIPEVEKLEPQLQAIAAKLGSAEGVRNFFRRVAATPRAHSVKDLLTFMHKGELPIADDGSVLVYKLLKTTKKDGVFVDVHSGNVRQRVGSRVFMAEHLVDHNRATECSNGLHVARRDYLHTFSGDVCVLAKLAPEDVIAVPHADARKLRACGYHIIAQLCPEDMRRVKNNQAMNDSELLGNAAAGNHVGVLELVEIGGHNGSKLNIQAVAEVPTEPLEDCGRRVESLDSLEQVERKVATVDAKAVATTVAAARIQGKSVRQIEADRLYQVFRAATGSARREAALALLDFKKKSKVSWDTLGLSNDIYQDLVEAKDAPPMPKVATPAQGTPRERIAVLLNQGPLTKEIAMAVYEIKRKAKKHWNQLGIVGSIEQQILKLIDKV